MVNTKQGKLQPNALQINESLYRGNKSLLIYTGEVTMKGTMHLQRNP